MGGEGIESHGMMGLDRSIMTTSIPFAYVVHAQVMGRGGRGGRRGLLGCIARDPYTQQEIVVLIGLLIIADGFSQVVSGDLALHPTSSPSCPLA